jgi:hypothetical protein
VMFIFYSPSRVVTRQTARRIIRQHDRLFAGLRSGGRLVKVRATDYPLVRLRW